VVSVLVCTLANVATLGQRLETEALHQQMQRFFALILEEVERYGGTLQRMLDDGTLVLFGAPVAYEDHALRAVLAALGLQHRLTPSWSATPWRTWCRGWCVWPGWSRSPRPGPPPRTPAIWSSGDTRSGDLLSLARRAS
jgi:hypothetical protein